MCDTESNTEQNANCEWEQQMLELTVVLSVYAVIGFLGNGLILIVYCRRKSKLSHSTYICTLATLDLLVCCVFIPYTIAYERRLIQYDVICHSLEILRHGLVISSNEMLCAIAFNRYFSVFKPMRLQTSQKARMVVIIVLVNSFIAAIPSVSMFKVTTSSGLTSPVTASQANVTDVTPQDAHAYCQFTIEVIGLTWTVIYQGMLALEFFVSIIIMVVIYVKVYLEIWRRAKWRNKIAVTIKTNDSLKSKEGNSSQGRDGQCVFSTKSSKFSPPSDSHQRPSQTPQNRMQPRVTSVGCSQDGMFTAGNRIPWIRTPEPPGGMDTLQIPSRVRVIPVDTAAVRIQNCADSEGNRVRYVIPGASNNNANATSDATTTSRRSQLNQRKAGTMLFICTLIYFVTWLPFWMDIFGLTNNLVFRYTFLLGHVTNPLVYSVVNAKVRAEVKRTLLCE